MYNQLTPEIIEEIKKVSNNVFLGEEINPDYAKDEMPIYGTHMPDLAVQPRSTEEVAAVMKICYENNIPVTPRGAGTTTNAAAISEIIPLYPIIFAVAITQQIVRIVFQYFFRVSMRTFPIIPKEAP